MCERDGSMRVGEERVVREKEVKLKNEGERLEMLERYFSSYVVGSVRKMNNEVGDQREGMKQVRS